VFEVDVLVASVEDLEHGGAGLAAADGGQDEVGLVEVEGGVAGGCGDAYFHVAAGDVYFCLVDEEL
jgi:hypothetical protein